MIQLQGPTITLDVASSGSAYLVRVRTAGTRSAFDNCLSNALGGSSGSTSGSTAGSLDFDSWGVAVAITPPAHPIDASGISGG